MLNAIGLANPGRDALPGRDAAGLARPRHPALGLGRRLLGRASTRRPARRSTTSRSSSTSPARTSTRRPSRRRRSSPPAARRPRCRSTRSSRRPRRTSARLARAVEAAGADGLSLVNTIRGLALDAAPRARGSHAATGGYSGPAAEADRARRRLRLPRRSSELPIVGMGGVCERPRRARDGRLRRDPRRARNGALRRPRRAGTRASASSQWSSQSRFWRPASRPSAPLSEPVVHSWQLG